MRLPPLLDAMRPRQWVKNFFVFAPLLFSQRWTEGDRVLRTVAAAGLFCAASSTIYLVNDVLDREADRLHPKKRLRAIASGALSPAVAIAAAVALCVGALAGAWYGLRSEPVALVLATYLAIQSLYSWRLKHLVLLDVLCIASGFVLRLLVGGFAADVKQTSWILLCTIFVSLFLALCKRRHEQTSLGEGASDHRAILAEYPVALLDQLIAALATATIVAYSLYTVDATTATVHHLPSPQESLPPLLLTVPYVVYGIFRYLFLVHRRDGGGSPASTLARDVPSIVNVVLFAVTTYGVLRLARLPG